MNIKKTILIIGSGLEQLEAYKICKKLNLTIVALDKNYKAPCLKFADYYIKASNRNINDCLKKISAFNKKKKIDAFFSVGTDTTLLQYKISKLLGLKFLTYKSAQISTNKIKMKNFFKINKINTPKFKFVNKIQHISKFAKKNNFPIVLKPYDGRGAEGVLKIKNVNDLNKYKKFFFKNLNKKKIIVEKFLRGKQYSIEGVIVDGKYEQAICSERNYDKKDLYPFIIENGGHGPILLKENLQHQVNEIANKISKILKLSFTTIKFDILVNGSRVYIIEFTLRLSGGYLSSHQIPFSTGLNILKLKILNSISKNKKKIKIDYIPHRYFSIRYLFPKKGYLKQIIFSKKIKIKNNKNIKIFNFKKNINKNIDNITKHSDRYGPLMLTGNNLKMTIKKSESILNNLKLIYGCS